jgi:hypothetical protein
MTHLYEGRRVDSDREGPDMCKPTLELDAVGHGREGEYAGAGREEMTCVVISVEADEVRIEHTEKNLAAHRQDPACNKDKRWVCRQQAPKCEPTCRSRSTGMGYGGRIRL